MNSSRIATARTIVSVTVIALTASVFAMSVVDTRSPETRAKEWAKATATTGHIPVTLAGVSTLPLPYRHEAFLQMTPVQRSGVWQEQFAKVAARPEMTAEQRALLMEYRALLTPQLYDLDNPNRDNLAAATGAYCARIQALFNDDQRWALKHLGPRPTGSSESRLVAFARIVQSTLGTTLYADPQDDCKCNKDLGACDCTTGQLCKTESCTEIILNCGCGGTAVNCDRHCAAPGGGN
jgi:hypothetical protein